MNKRILTILTALCLTGALAGCGTGKSRFCSGLVPAGAGNHCGHHRAAHHLSADTA